MSKFAIKIDSFQGLVSSLLVFTLSSLRQQIKDQNSHSLAPAPLLVHPQTSQSS